MEEVKPLIKYGWLRALIYFVGIFALMLLLSAAEALLVAKLHLSAKDENGSIQSFGIIYAIIGIGVYGFTLLLRKFIDKRSFISLGFTWKTFGGEAALGFFIAVTLLGIGSLVLVCVGYVTFLSIHVNTYPLLAGLSLMVVVAFVEELMFRGYILNNLMQSMNKWIALIISAAVFALVHCSNPDVTVLAIVNVFLAGVFLGLNYIFTKNLWFGIFFHFAWNFLQGPILGYDVSGLKLQSLFQQAVTGPEFWTGGPFGFEGSALCPLLLSLSIIALVYGFERKYVATKAM